MKKILDKTDETDIEQIRKDPKNANWNSLTWFYCEYDDFIEEFQEYINWWYLCGCRKITRDFIYQYKDKVNWDAISTAQFLDKDFIIEFSDKVNFSLLLDNDNISDEVKEFCRMFV